MKDIKTKVIAWLQDNIDFAFILAAFTETPRWTVAFKAINEPTWIGIPLGVLLAFATAKAWRRYFETHDRRLLIFNIVSMCIAVLVIAPVIYSLTSTKADSIVLSKVLTPFQLGAWAMLLAVTTFLPLVQLAAVSEPVAKQSVGEDKQPAKRVTRTVSVARTETQSEQYTLQPEPERATLTIEDATPLQLPATIEHDAPIILDIASMNNEQKKQHLATVLASSDAPSKAALARQYGVARTTLDRWIAEVQQ